MGSVFGALGDTKTMLAHNTFLWAGGGAITLVLSLLILIPFVGLFFVPVLATGLVGLAFAARDGNASFEDFTASVSENYVNYLLATLISGLVVGAIVVLFIFVMVLFVFVGSFSGSGTDGASAGAGLGLAIVGGYVLVFVVSFLVGLAIQFFDVAIVLDDAGPIDAFKRSLALLRNEPLSVLGYTLMRSLLSSVVFGLPLTGVMMLVFGSALATAGSGGGETVGLVALVGFAVWGLVVLPIGQVIMVTYHVAFYNRHRSAGTI